MLYTYFPSGFAMLMTALAPVGIVYGSPLLNSLATMNRVALSPCFADTKYLLVSPDISRLMFVVSFVNAAMFSPPLSVYILCFLHLRL